MCGSKFHIRIVSSLEHVKNECGGSTDFMPGSSIGYTYRYSDIKHKIVKINLIYQKINTQCILESLTEIKGNGL
jgi:hypothetical protein